MFLKSVFRVRPYLLIRVSDLRAKVSGLRNLGISRF